MSEVLRYLSRITLDPLTPADLAVLYNYCFKEGKGSVTVRSELASMPVMMATDGSRHSLASTPLQFYWPDERFLKTVGGLDAATLEVVSIIVSCYYLPHPVQRRYCTPPSGKCAFKGDRRLAKRRRYP